MSHTLALVVKAGRDRQPDDIADPAWRRRLRLAVDCSIAQRRPRRACQPYQPELRATRSRACEACCRQIRSLLHLLASPIAAAHRGARLDASWVRVGLAGAQGQGAGSEGAWRKA